MMTYDPIDIIYRTLTTRERLGPYGWFARQVAAHPIRTGFLGGLTAIAIALIRGWEGARTMPEAAFILCLLVLVVWTVLFFFMRSFFESQTQERLEVVRRIQLDPDNGFVWSQGSTILCEESKPLWRLCRAPEEQNTPDNDEKPWLVWLVMTSEDDPAARLDKKVIFTLETKLMWKEARGYPIEHHTSDEKLPTHVASPLLERGRDAMSITLL